MKTLTLALLALISVHSAFASETYEETNGDIIVLNVGETKVIAGSSISCQAPPSEKVCKVENVYRSPWSSDYEVQVTAYSPVHYEGGTQRNEALVVSVGTFKTIAPAQARMLQLQKAGYCL